MRRLLCLIFILLVLVTACSWPGSQVSLPGEPDRAETQLRVPSPQASPTSAPSPTWMATATLPLATITPEGTRNSSLQGQDFTCPVVDKLLATGGQVPVYRARVVNAFPHDPGAYTQGLIYRDGFLYEGTGLYGASSLRKVVLETGQVLQQIDLPEAYFGEGISELDGRLYQLTWQEGVGFVYDLDTFGLEKSFSYPTEGWGLTTDGKQLIMSDGSSRLFFLDPLSLQLTGSLVVQDRLTPVELLNELEWVDGEVWANIYTTDCIARIDPNSGTVVGWIDVSGLLSAEEASEAEVPNGIAYDPQSGRIFVSGKWWPKLFEIELERIN